MKREAVFCDVCGRPFASPIIRTYENRDWNAVQINVGLLERSLTYVAYDCCDRCQAQIMEVLEKLPVKQPPMDEQTEQETN